MADRKEVVILDDDDSDDAKAKSSVVDLTSEKVASLAASGRRENGGGKRRRRRDVQEVQFMGSTSLVAVGRGSSAHAAAAAASATRNNTGVQFMGTKKLPQSPRTAQSSLNNYAARASAGANTSNNSFPFGGLPNQNDSFNFNSSSANRQNHFTNSFDNRFNNYYPPNRGGGGGGGIMESIRNFARNFGYGGGDDQHVFGMRGNGAFNNGSMHGNRRRGRTDSPAGNKRGKKRSASKGAAKEKPEEPKAMVKGKAMQQPQGFDALDMYYPRLKANERTLILHNMLSSTTNSKHTKKFVHDWRVKFEKGNAKATLWSLAKALSEEVTRLEQDLDQKMPAKKVKSGGNQRQKENKPLGNAEPTSSNADDRPVSPVPAGIYQKKGMVVVSASAGSKGEARDEPERKPTAPIGPLSGEVLDTLTMYFLAHLGRASHKAMLGAIQPTENPPDGLTCSICAEDFDASDTVACTGDDIHFMCKPCLASYCTVTVQSGPIQSMSCPMPKCNSLFATHDVKSTLSEWDVLMIAHREDSRNRRVALAAKAMLHCECGTVAIITEEDMGDGRIACPGKGCGRRFCAKCGNDDHGKELCPPPAETVQWLDKNSKECPNCKNRIQKNGGCDHMTCSPPGGCGYEFWWTCGCPYRSHSHGRCPRP